MYNRAHIVYPTEIGYKSSERVEQEQKAGSVDGAGIHCDFCHKIKAVEVNDAAGVNGSITLNRVDLDVQKEKREKEFSVKSLFVQLTNSGKQIFDLFIKFLYINMIQFLFVFQILRNLR